MSKEKKKTPMEAYYSIEDWLNKQTNTNSIEAKSAIIWGALTLLCGIGEITSEEKMSIYASFMSHCTGVK